MSAKVVRRRLTDDLDKQEAALEGQGGLLETLCVSLAAMAKEMWGEAGRWLVHSLDACACTDCMQCPHGCIVAAVWMSVVHWYAAWQTYNRHMQ